MVVHAITWRMNLEESGGVRRIWLAMAGKSPHAVVLTEDQRGELGRRAVAYSGPYRDVVRAKAILYAAEGATNQEIAERLDVSRQAVSDWRKRFCHEGLQGLEERPRSGRPRRFPPGAGRRGQGAGVRASGAEQCSALALVQR